MFKFLNKLLEILGPAKQCLKNELLQRRFFPLIEHLAFHCMVFTAVQALSKPLMYTLHSYLNK